MGFAASCVKDDKLMVISAASLSVLAMKPGTAIPFVQSYAYCGCEFEFSSTTPVVFAGQIYGVSNWIINAYKEKCDRYSYLEIADFTYN